MTHQYVCPTCGVTNRLPEQRDASLAKCGRCSEPLFTGQPVDVTGAGLSKHRHQTKGAAVLLDVWAPWCGPCRSMAPHFAAAAGHLEPKVRFLKLNSEAEPQASSTLGIFSIPALILFQDGTEVGRKAGLMSTDQIVDWVEQVLGH